MAVGVCKIRKGREILGSSRGVADQLVEVLLSTLRLLAESDVCDVGNADSSGLMQRGLFVLRKPDGGEKVLT